MATVWKRNIESTGKKSATFDVALWLSKATLDIIGDVAFDYKVRVIPFVCVLGTKIIDNL